MPACSIRIGPIAALASTVLLGGCAFDPVARARKEEPRVQREADLQALWRGRSYHSLLDRYGQPVVVMDVPGHRSVKTSIVVYGAEDDTLYCIDAFTVIVIEEKILVSDYFCR